MNIIILVVRIIEDSDNRGSDNRGCTVPGRAGSLVQFLAANLFHCALLWSPIVKIIIPLDTKTQKRKKRENTII